MKIRVRAMTVCSAALALCPALALAAALPAERDAERDANTRSDVRDERAPEPLGAPGRPMLVGVRAEGDATPSAAPVAPQALRFGPTLPEPTALEAPSFQ